MIAMFRGIFNLWHLVGVKLIKMKINFHDWASKKGSSSSQQGGNWAELKEDKLTRMYNKQGT